MDLYREWIEDLEKRMDKIEQRLDLHASNPSSPPSCGTCRHWEALDGDNLPKEWRQCLRIKPRHEYGAFPGDPLSEELASEIVMTHDGDGFCSALLSRASFGCVLHQPLLSEVSTPS